MPETQRTLFNLRRRPHIVLCSRCLCACGLLIAGAFVLLFAVFFAFFTETETLTIKETADSPEYRGVDRTRPVFDSEAFYATIIENNLFRPLGWTPPRPIEPYRLIGTILPRSANTPPQAIIQSTAGNTTYIVSLGEKIDASTEVVGIEAKQVTLSIGGQERLLSLEPGNLFLNGKRSGVVVRRPSPVVSRGGVDRPRSSGVSSARPPMRRRSVLPDRVRPYSDWETVEGERIPFGDARLKNPQKWGLRRR